MNVGELYKVLAENATLWTGHEKSDGDRPQFASVKRNEFVMILTCENKYIRVEVLTKTGACGWVMRQYLSSSPTA